MTKFKNWACFRDGGDDDGCDTSTAEEQGNVPDSDNLPTWQQ